jgi:predicted enzyme related to lactoylglutathione lyase
MVTERISARTRRILMNQGAKTIIYPIKDIARAKTLYTVLLGVEPFSDEAYYVGFMVGDQQIGLDPNGHAQGMTGPVAYCHVDDIKGSLESLTDAGAQIQQEVKDFGGRLVASVRDTDGNVIGLIQES